MVARQRTQESLNSYAYNEPSVRQLVNSKIQSCKLTMPPNRETMLKLFLALNLTVTPVKCIDCLLFIIGPKLENSDPEEYDPEKLITWFMLNIRNLKHINLKEVDKDWVDENIV